MNQNQEIIHRFYKAFQARDWATMQSSYHPEAHFNDPVFPSLNSLEVKAMWHMLCENAQNFSLQYSEVSTKDDEGTCRWDARYTFSKTGRNVHNLIQAHLNFKDGLIIKHTDTFNFWRWSSMALGLSGILLGWTPFLIRKVQLTAQKSLHRFKQEHPQYSE
jgi:ketosteroid isomerase-like protein